MERKPPFPVDLSDEQRPYVEYPCAWPYTVIGEQGDTLGEAIASVLLGDEVRWRRNRASRNGRYTSFHVTVEVRDESHRNDVFQRLRGILGVKIVL